MLVVDEKLLVSGVPDGVPQPAGRHQVTADDGVLKMAPEGRGVEVQWL